jgi:hypothetical protein
LCRGRCGAGGERGGGEPAPTRGCCEARESVGLDAVPSRERGMLDGDAPAPQLAAHATLVHQLPQVRRRAEQPHQLLHAGAAGCRQLGERRRSRFFLPHGAATTGGCRRALCRAGRHRNVAALLQGLPQQARQLDGELAGNLRLELRRPLAPERPQLLTQRRERILALPELPRELRLGSVQPAQQHILLPHHFFFPNSRPPGAGQGAQTASPCWRRSDIAATGRCCGLLLSQHAAHSAAWISSPASSRSRQQQAFQDACRRTASPPDAIVYHRYRRGRAPRHSSPRAGQAQIHVGPSSSPSLGRWR